MLTNLEPNVREKVYCILYPDEYCTQSIGEGEQEEEDEEEWEEEENSSEEEDEYNRKE